VHRALRQIRHLAAHQMIPSIRYCDAFTLTEVNVPSIGPTLCRTVSPVPGTSIKATLWIKQAHHIHLYRRGAPRSIGK